MLDYAPEPGHEHFIPDLASAMNAADPQSLYFSMSKYQIFEEQAPTAVLASASTELGLIMWNLGPGQENDYHVHPQTEHLHIIIAGEVEYTLGEGPPRIMKVGEAVLVPAGIPHGIRNVSDAPASYFAVGPLSAPYVKTILKRP
jgi:quercetin dioxygenase-like cupin family protein